MRLCRFCGWYGTDAELDYDCPLGDEHCPACGDSEIGWIGKKIWKVLDWKDAWRAFTADNA